MLSCRPSSFIVMIVSRLLLPVGGFHLLLDWSLKLAVSSMGPILDPSVTVFVSFLKWFFKCDL